MNTQSLEQRKRHQELTQLQKKQLLYQLEAEFGCLLTQVTRARDRYEQNVGDPQHAEERVRHVLRALKKVVEFLDR